MKRAIHGQKRAGKIRLAARIAALATIILVATVGMARTTLAEPSFGVDVFSPSAPPGDILEPAPGSPQVAPLPLPVTVIPAFALGLPFGEVDALSYGDDVFPPAGPWHLEFSTGPGATGHALSPIVSAAQPNVLAETVIGDGSNWGDIYSSFEVTGAVPGSFGAFSAVFPPAPCGFIHSDIQTADEDGSGPMFGAPNVGLGLSIFADNLDTLEIPDSTAVDFFPPGGDGIPDGPIFFSVDPATAAGLPLLPPFFAGTTAADVLVWDPGTATLWDWAPFFLLGLGPGDDIDALTVGYTSGAPFGGGWGGFPDTILLSLAPGSPALAGLPTLCFGAAATPGDVYAAFAVGGPLFAALDAEMIGLNTVRSGGGADDNLDAIDVVLASFVDTDGDLIDDAADFDDDNDLLGDSRDAGAGCSPIAFDTDGDGLNDYDEVVTYGTNCAAADTDGDGVSDGDEVNIYGTNPIVADTDGDGCSDGREVQTAPGTQFSGGRRNPLNPNDYFNPSGDLQNRIDDILDVVLQYFMDDTDGNPGLPPYTPGYTPITDRTFIGPDLWDLGPPNGLQRVDDILNQLHQYFHDCV